MDILQLPSLPAVTPIRQAWGVLQAAQRSAIITMAGDRPALMTAEDLARGENRGLKTLAELEAQSVPVGTKVAGQRRRACDARILVDSAVVSHLLQTGTRIPRLRIALPMDESLHERLPLATDRT